MLCAQPSPKGILPGVKYPKTGPSTASGVKISASLFSVECFSSLRKGFGNAALHLGAHEKSRKKWVGSSPTTFKRRGSPPSVFPNGFVGDVVPSRRSGLRQTALRELLRRHIISLLPSRPARSLPERALAGCAPLVPRRVLALPATSPDRSRLRAVVVLAARASAAATADCRGRERRQAQEQQAAHALQGERAPALSSGLSCHLNPCSSLVSLRRSFRRSMSTHAALLPH